MSRLGNSTVLMSIRGLVQKTADAGGMMTMITVMHGTHCTGIQCHQLATVVQG